MCNVQAVQIAVTAAVAEAAAPPPPPPPPPERTRELEERVLALTAELKAANDKYACALAPSWSANSFPERLFTSIVFQKYSRRWFDATCER